MAKARKAKAGPYLHSDDNARVRITCAPDEVPTIPTHDLYDRAHARRDPWGLIIPAAERLGDGSDRATPDLAATPRRYHISQMVTLRTDARGRPVSGLAADSAFDAWWETYRELVAAGIPLGGFAPGEAWSGTGADELRRRQDLGDLRERRRRNRRITQEEVEEAQRIASLRRNRRITQEEVEEAPMIASLRRAADRILRRGGAHELVGVD